MKAAKAAYEQGTSERRPILREVYLYTLRAFNAYVAVEVSPGVNNERIGPSRVETSASDQQYRALMEACGLE